MANDQMGPRQFGRLTTTLFEPDMVGEPEAELDEKDAKDDEADDLMWISKAARL